MHRYLHPLFCSLTLLCGFLCTALGQNPSEGGGTDALAPVTITKKDNSGAGQQLKVIKCYPRGLMKAYNVSFDDGKLASDKQVIVSLRKYKVPATFFINSTHVQSADAIAQPDEYAGFEIASHGANHKGLGKMPLDKAREEIATDIRLLGAAFKFKIEGFAYPYGDIPQDRTPLEAVMKELGIVYARGTRATQTYRPPESFLNWHPDCPLDQNMLKHLDKYQKLEAGDSIRNWMEFAHSIDFVNGKYPLTDWDTYIERLSKDETIWKATYLDYVHYVNALRALVITDKGAENKSAIPVWITVDGKAIEIPAGATHTW